MDLTIDRDPSSIVTVGTFDGVHLGHQALVRYLVERARARGGRSVVVSFDPHPREVLTGEAVPLLSTPAERGALVQAFGVEAFVVLPFTRALAEMPPEAFVEDVLAAEIGLREIVIGYDHGFGHGRQGDGSLLERLGQRLGFTVDVIPPREVGEEVVSSTKIRQLLADDGAVEQAAELLGRSYSLAGEVVPGDGRGRTIGFPTANLALDDARKVVPRRGVYAVRATLDDGTPRGGMMNIGLRPTFGGTTRHLEAHLFDHDADLYGQGLRIEFVKRLRDERKFDSVEALVEQLSEDRKRCRRALESAA